MHHATVDLSGHRQSITGILVNLQQFMQTFPAIGTDNQPSAPLGDWHQWLAEIGHLTGNPAYLPEQKNRDLYRQGRIHDTDLNAALSYFEYLNTGQPLAGATREAMYRMLLLHGLPFSDNSPHWQSQERMAPGHLQGDVPDAIRKKLTEEEPETAAVHPLWRDIANKLSLAPNAPLDGSKSTEQTANLGPHALTRQQAELEFDLLLANLGKNHSLRDFVLTLSGHDVLDDVRPQLLRIISSALDQGIASWHLPDTGQAGLYQAWRTIVPADANLFLHQLPDWQETIAELPEQVLDCISLQLIKLGIPPSRWESYLRRLLFELPGCSRVVTAQEPHPQRTTVALADYLAIRLVLDRLWLNQTCHDLWQVEAKFSALTAYFQKNLSEFFVRKYLYQGQLPEHLAALAEALIIRAGSERQCRGDWQQLADLLYGWWFEENRLRADRHPVTDNHRLLFHCCLHLGFDAQSVRQLEQNDLSAILQLANAFDAQERGKIWLFALEHRYRQRLFDTLQTKQRTKENRPPNRPTAQFVFCLDNREEGLRRYLESLDATIETYGTRGFYCRQTTAAHDATPQQEPPKWPSLSWLFGQPLVRQRLPVSFLAIILLAPFVLLALLGKTLWPKATNRWLEKWHTPKTGLNSKPTADLSLTDAACSELGAEFLLDMGLTSGFSDWVVLVGHSRSGQSGSHPVCLACNGRNLGLQAEALAAILNRPAIRQTLAGRGIDIPPQTRFIAAEHDGNGVLHWHLPPQQVEPPPLQQLRNQLHQALNLACQQQHQSRTGYNLPVSHANHAALVIARRQLTRSLALDGRAFLLSYDPSQDINGKRLENILTASLAGLVNLNLAYYLASVDNRHFGSGNETSHNPVGLFTAFSGTDSDFCDGLSLQQVAGHEAMRLTIVVETPVNVLETVLDQNDSLLSWFTGHWAYLSVIDPTDGSISHYRPGAGFQLSASAL